MNKLLFLIVTLSMLTVLSSACSTPAGADLQLLPLDQFPSEVQVAPVVVQQAYQFASANPDLMKDIPCYCGCGSIGHASNYACYVSQVDDRGGLIFDNHALGCSICVDITQDVMRLMREGKSPQEARAYIDAAYSRYGPSNIP